MAQRSQKSRNDALELARSKATGPFQSVLNPHFYEILQLRSGPAGLRKTWREIAEILKQTHGIEISHNSVFNFMKARTGPGSGFEHPQLFPTPSPQIAPVAPPSAPVAILKPSTVPLTPLKEVVPVKTMPSLKEQRDLIRQKALSTGTEKPKEEKPKSGKSGFTWKE